MTRTRLPDRRPALTIDIEHAGFRCALSVGIYDDGGIGEVFVSGLKSGSSLDALVADAAVLVSRLLQHGVAADDLARSIARLGSDQPASLIGAVVDLVVLLDKETRA